MWGNVRSRIRRKPRNRSRKILPNQNQSPKSAPATWEGTTAMSTDAMRPLGATGDRATARLGSSLHVKGEITGSEDLLIDGSVEGLIQLDERKLTVGATAKVTADIIAREVVVYGTVKGNLRAKDRIEIKKDGSVNGDLTTARIMIEDGAYFKGSIEIDKSAEKETSQRVCQVVERGCAGGCRTEEHLTISPALRCAGANEGSRRLYFSQLQFSDFQF